MKLADRLRECRKRANLTQSKLAEMIDLSPSAIRMYETDKRTPSIDILKKIATVLNISINELVGFDVAYNLPISENSKITVQVNGISTAKSLTPQDYACEFIRSHFIDVRRTEVIDNNNSDKTKEIVKINDVEYNQNEFDALMDEAIDFILFKVEKKRKAHHNHSDK